MYLCYEHYYGFFQPNGFTIELTNTNANTVMVGVRVLVCSQSQERTPTYLEIFGRSTQVRLFFYYYC